MNPRTYDILKYIGRFVIPAVTAFWLSISKIWSLPYGVEIGATLAAFGVLWNAVLQVNSNNYEKELVKDLRDDVDRSDNAPIHKED